tara:strand:+ start:147 stop:533 length:387 start_codon:yes stop_codon:yes gene_type:complete
MASILKVDTITGVSTAGSIAVTGEGNSTTTNLQQGLAKAWHQSDNAAAQADSLNVSGGTDNGTGDYTISFTNSMANNNFAPPHITAEDANHVLHAHTRATGSVRVNNVNESAAARDASTAGTVHGDLA